jgi:hypothetical protein
MFGPRMWTLASTRPIGPGKGLPQPLVPPGGGVGAGVGGGVGAAVGAGVGVGVVAGGVALGLGEGAGVDPATGKNGIGIVSVPEGFLVVGAVGNSSVMVWHPARTAAERIPRSGFFM